MMEFLECGTVDEIMAGHVDPTKTLRDFQRSAHHRLKSEDGVSYCALVRRKNDDVTVIAGDNAEEIKIWIGLREVDAELIEMRDPTFH